LIGKRVTFKVDYSVASIAREFGRVFVGDENVALAHVADGWAKVKDSSSQNDDDADALEALRLAEQSASANEMGIWSKDPTALARASRAAPASFDARAFFAAHKGIPVPAVVEACLNGTCLKVALATDSVDSRHAVATVHMAGVQCPAMGRREKKESSDESSPATPEPFAREAKHNTEIRLLHRDVLVIFEGEDKYKNLFCTIRVATSSTIQPDQTGTAPVEDVAEVLARAGLAKVVDWSAALMTSGAQRLRAAEKAAKAQRLRLWHDYVAPTPSIDAASGAKEFDAVVVEAVSGDVLMVAEKKTGVERRVHLASVRAPRVGNERRGVKAEPWAVEAKEFLRKRCVGKPCRVKMEYARKSNPGGDGEKAQDARLMEFGTVLLANDGDPSGAASDAGELLLIRGLASCVKHRGEEERSSRYDDLCAAERRAVASKKGLQNPNKEAPTHHANDIAGNAGKAKQFLPFLQRAGRCHGIVEYVVAGHRFKLAIPKEGAVVSFALAGVRCPQPPRPGDTNAEAEDKNRANDAAAALAFARRHAMQRDVEIEVDAVDKAGTFLGNLFLVDGSSGNKVELGEWLLREGLGSLHPSFRAESKANGSKLTSLMEAARRARVGMWRDWSPEAEAAKAAAETAARNERAVSSNESDARDVSELTTLLVTEIVSGSRFFAQRASDAEKADWMHARLNDQNAAAFVPDAAFRPKRGSTVAALFTGDDKWYRAVVVEQAKGVDTEGVALVHFGDFGNRERLPATRLRPVDPSLGFHALPALAHLCALRGVKAPAPGADYAADAAGRLADLAGGRLTPSRVDRAFAAPAKPWDDDAAPELLVTLGVDPLEDEKSSSGTTSKADGLDGDDEVDTADATAESPVSVVSVNETLVAEGLCRADRQKLVSSSAFAKRLFAAQERARADRAGMWEYGDVDSDDDDTSVAKPGAWGRRR
jgi:staphylococcal nuclease domain-containing protein 1